MESLRDLGLSSYEDRAYRGLLSLGTGTAAAVAEESGVPKGRVYDALGGLESRGLVRVQTDREPKRYAPVEPAVAVDRLVETKRRELRQRIETYESGKSELIDRLADAETTDDEFWTAAVGADDSLDLLFERIDAAEESIVVVATDVSAQFDVDREGPELLDRLLGAIRSGVDVSVLLSPDVFDDARAAVDADRATLTIAQGPFELRITEDAYGNFYLIDGEEVCLEVADPLAPDRLFGMLDLRDRGFAARVRDGFEAAWADGTVVDDV
ncbi:MULTISPECIES: TrmB family transcriptional regulator [Halorubrum]|uniref:Transcriptional regulator, TrmB n=1 Tax=Halorubrum hochstenium ATCC 700873 TaxID=1227481 RepID=M0F3R0_9EURY|nr:MULTISPECIES: helix-turn-helix domain-containing protein [Halorubrum]ELZ54520.1 transcriptional regulator, TrmB [Halorubrum hochstenium ATCC 700873]